MKNKNNLYQDAPIKVPHFLTLRTASLFARNTKGELVHATRQDPPHPEIAERRGARRFEWRKSAFCRVVRSNGDLSDWSPVWGCEVSKGGLSLLAETEVPKGAYLDLYLPGVAEVGELPLAQVVHCARKGGVWLVRCQWLLELHQPGVRLLLGKPEKKKYQPASTPGQQRGWLLRLWSLFHGA